MTTAEAGRYVVVDAALNPGQAGLGGREIPVTVISVLITTPAQPQQPFALTRGRNTMTLHAKHTQSRTDAYPRHHRSRPATCAARDHIRQLREHGATYRAITQAAGLGATTVRDTATQRWQPTPATTAALLRVTPRSFTRARVDAGGTWLRLRALHVMGHNSARLARAVGASEKTIRALVNGDARTVSVRLRDRVVAVYDRWWDKRAPERTPAERSAARAARRRAIAGNWCAAAALDDDQLDTPGYKPRYGWRPATGTGVATDVHPTRRPQARRSA